VRLLITGISGFIGGSVGRYAAQAGHVVKGTGRRKQAGKEWMGLYTPLTDVEDLAELIGDFLPDVLLHAAGTASVGASIADPLEDFRGSVQTCADVLDAVRRSGNKPLVVIPSSAAVYGNPVSLPVTENACIQPISPYGFHKAACELLAREYAECFGLKIMICRFFSVYGAAQRRLLVWELYRQLAGPEDIAWLDGTGNETRDFLYIEDLVAALLGLMKKPQSADDQPIVVNVASGTETGVLTLAGMIRDLVAPGKEIRCRGNVRKNDPMSWRANTDHLQILVPSWRPHALAEGLALCVSDWREADRLSLQHGS
jgi:UDP-glucose 4-epimerase